MPQPSRAPKPRATKPQTAQFDPATARFAGEEWCEERQIARLELICPSRSRGTLDHTLTTDEDGNRAECSCEACRFMPTGAGPHTRIVPQIIRTVFYNIYAVQSENQLQALDKAMAPRFGQGSAIRSIRYEVLGDALARFGRLRDPVLLRSRAKQADDDLFGAPA